MNYSLSNDGLLSRTNTLNIKILRRYIYYHAWIIELYVRRWPHNRAKRRQTIQGRREYNVQTGNGKVRHAPASSSILGLTTLRANIETRDLYRVVSYFTIETSIFVQIFR